MTEHQRQEIIQQLKTEERTRCEIWSRVMGYHRPVHTWNLGKKQEHADRTLFQELATRSGQVP